MRAVLIFFMAGMLLISEQSSARTCARIDLAKALKEADVVFTGKILEYGDASDGADKVAKVKISESYKGVPPQDQVYFDSKFGHCGLSSGMLKKNELKDEELLFLGARISSKFFVNSPFGIYRIDSLLKEELKALKEKH